MGSLSVDRMGPFHCWFSELGLLPLRGKSEPDSGHGLFGPGRTFFWYSPR